MSVGGGTAARTAHPQAPSGGQMPGGLPPAPAGDRFGAYVLDGLLAVLTLGIGWLIWSIILWSKGTSPGKQMVGLRVVDVRTCRVVGGGQMAMRELVGKSLLGMITCGITSIVGAFQVLFGRRRVAVWDQVAGTIVVRDSDLAAGVPGGAIGQSSPAPPPPSSAPVGAAPPPLPSPSPAFAGPPAKPTQPSGTNPFITPPVVPAPSPENPSVPVATQPRAPAAGPAPVEPARQQIDGAHANASMSPILGVCSRPGRPAMPEPGAVRPPAVDPNVEDPTVRRSPARTVQLVFDDGRRVDLRATTLLGRDPGPMAQFPGAALVTVDDPWRQLSKTHAAVGVEGDAIWVEDCNSTNGTSLRSPDGRERPLVGRQRVSLGEQVALGERTFVAEVSQWPAS